jgi:hypothetical protein
MHVLGRTYAAVRDLQVVKSAGKLQTEKAALYHCGDRASASCTRGALAENGRQGIARSAKTRTKRRGHNKPASCFLRGTLAVHDIYVPAVLTGLW